MDTESIRHLILSVAGENVDLPQAREIGVLLLEMVDDDDQQRLAKAAQTNQIHILETVVKQIMDDQGLDREAFELPEDLMSTQVVMDKSRSDRLNHLHHLLFSAGGGTRIATSIFEFLADIPHLVSMFSVCKLWHKILSEDTLWKSIAIRKWRFLESKVSEKSRALISNWRKFTVTRWVVLQSSRSKFRLTNFSNRRLPTHDYPVLPIENCHWGLAVSSQKDMKTDAKTHNSKRRKPNFKLGQSSKLQLPTGFLWGFKCPVALDLIKTNPDTPKVDFCTVCKKSVYLVNDEKELKSQVEKGNCVALDFDRKVLTHRGRRPRVAIMRGRIVARR
ncbi:hypothetical protein AAMO2058_001394800 [Amorphochlora amoebiformis]